MSSAEAYAAAYPSCMLALGDLNGDGQVNTFDIDLFVDVMGGNLMSARRYQYDEENRLTAVAEIDGNPLLEIEYDALGRRIATIDYEAPGGPQQMRHVYSGLNTVAEYVWSGSQWTLGREVLWGDRFPEPLALFDFTAAGDVEAGTEEVLHYVHDALGSVVGLVDAGDPDATPAVAPKLVERYDYDPYGKTYIETWDASAGGGSGAWVRTMASAYGNPFAWTGQRYDPGVGMYHFPFRSFSPELGRWMQRDPLGYVDGVNLYEALMSSPMNYTDPTGTTHWILSGDDTEVWVTFADGREYRFWVERDVLQLYRLLLYNYYPYGTIESIVIWGHGEPGGQFVGQRSLVPGDPLWKQIAGLVDAKGYIVLAGCYVGQGAAGQRYVNTMAAQGRRIVFAQDLYTHYTYFWGEFRYWWWGKPTWVVGYPPVSAPTKTAEQRAAEAILRWWAEFARWARIQHDKASEEAMWGPFWTDPEFPWWLLDPPPEEPDITPCGTIM